MSLFLDFVLIFCDMQVVYILFIIQLCSAGIFNLHTKFSLHLLAKNRVILTKEDTTLPGYIRVFLRKQIGRNSKTATRTLCAKNNEQPVSTSKGKEIPRVTLKNALPSATTGRSKHTLLSESRVYIHRKRFLLFSLVTAKNSGTLFSNSL